jgi:hypothetical protein
LTGGVEAGFARPRLPPLAYETYPSSCQVTLTLHRTRAGVLDPNLTSASTFSLEQVRTIAFFAHS